VVNQSSAAQSPVKQIPPVTSVRKSSEDRIRTKWNLDNLNMAKNIATFIKYFDQGHNLDRNHFHKVTGWQFDYFLSDIDKLRFLLNDDSLSLSKNTALPINANEELNKKLKKKWSGCESTLSQVIKNFDMGEKPNASIFEYKTGICVDEFYNDIVFLREFVNDYIQKHY
jgi:hypothetical protein